jgi:hypothetical protein
MNWRFGLLLVVLLAKPVLPQGAANPTYRSQAIVAVLPGNPLDSRLYSLQRNVPTRAMVSYRPDSSFGVRFYDTDATKAVAVVKSTMDTLIHEMESRRAADPGYGSIRIQTPATPITSNQRPGAEGVLIMDGVRWGDPEKQKTSAQVSALMSALSNLQTLRAVAKQGSLSGDPDAVARQIRSSISFRQSNDSWIQVSLASPDPTFLRRLLDYIPKEKVDLSGSLPLADIDFVPTHMRNRWYIFNCCQTNPD